MIRVHVLYFSIYRFVIRRVGEDRKPSVMSRYSDFSESIGTLSPASSAASYAKQRAKALEVHLNNTSLIFSNKMS